ncbi:FtsH-binding integral membrane protein [Bradyrhizobium sp. USDA 4532]|uniref:YfhO family protein n=1 Tax=unclassified Bradyrhizobium TaxID=2631580 RepID=UPI0020A0F9E8|nr:MULTISPECIES: YfhO family protein [unclassified Bradyrhizobium]MCP1831711.1 FtsH-binding integral membrane protein [Bradyrhizobium sp. USDA 4545]MCP1916548.1 FtsH-binding integral membrane protein [Bradyrhizobium sp. USDA 4532]
MALLYCLMMALGLALSSVCIIPFIELSGMSSRSSVWTYSDFISYSLPLRQLPSVFVPYLFGGGGAGNSMPYFGAWGGMTEIMVFAGTGTLVAAVLAFGSRQSGDDTIFWCVMIVLALIACTIGENKLGRVMFHLPVLGSFRAQARAAITFTFAVAVLASFGISRIADARVSNRQIIIAGLVVLSATLVATSLVVSTNWWTQAAAASSIDWKFVAPRIMFAGSIVIATTVVLFFLKWAKNTSTISAVISCLLLAVVAIDLSQFGWFYEWRHGPIKNLTMSPEWEKIAKHNITSGGRILMLQEMPSGGTPLSPNLNLMHGVSSANGYGPLESKTYLETTGIDNSGFLSESPSGAVIETLAVSSVLVGRATAPAIRFGDCTRLSKKQILTLRLPEPLYASELEVVSKLGCSVNRKDGEIALSMRVVTSSGEVAIPLTVGRDTAEWAYDRADVKPIMQHSRATIDPRTTGDGSQGNRYVARLPIESGTRMPVEAIAIEVPAGNEGVVELNQLRLIDTLTGTHRDINLVELALSRPDTTTSAIEGYSVTNLGDRPTETAWLVSKTLQLPSLEATHAVRTGQLPGGGNFDPLTLALVERPLPALGSTESGAGNKVKRIEHTSARQVFEVSAPAPSLLFVSESYHPGWQARVNGVRTDLLRTNGAFQGVVVPAGLSVVELSFEPLSLIIGGAISISAAIFLGILFPIESWRRRRHVNARPESATL